MIIRIQLKHLLGAVKICVKQLLGMIMTLCIHFKFMTSLLDDNNNEDYGIDNNYHDYNNDLHS